MSHQRTEFEFHSGDQVNEWTIVRWVGKKDGEHKFACRCRCGAEKDVSYYSLRNGKSKCCGGSIHHTTTFEINGIRHRPCSMCKKVFPLTSEFWQSRSSNIYGFSTYCRACAAIKIKEWGINNPQKVLAHARHMDGQRRQQKNNSPSDITVAYLINLKTSSHACPLCGHEMSDVATDAHAKQIDHIIPLFVGGTHTIDNIRVICKACNIRRPKDGRDVIEKKDDRAQIS